MEANVAASRDRRVAVLRSTTLDVDARRLQPAWAVLEGPIADVEPGVRQPRFELPGGGAPLTPGLIASVVPAAPPAS